MRAAILALALSAAPAAAMDCASASSTVEAIICADAQLVALDAKIGALYARGLEESPEPETLRGLQFSWLADRNQCADQACVEAQYRQQTDRLQAYIDALDEAGPHTVSLEESRRRCLPYTPIAAPNAAVSCRVADWAPLGRIGGLERIFALYAISYRWNDQDIAFAAPVVLKQASDAPARLALDLMISDAPGLNGSAARGGLAPRHVRHRTVEGRLLFEVPMVQGGSEIRAFRLEDGAWKPLKPPIR